VSHESDSGWSFSTLKEYFEHIISGLRLYLDSKIADLKEYLVQQALAQAEAVKAALAAAEKAVNKAEANVEKWRESQNEWRTAMNDREEDFARKTEVEKEFESLEKLAEQKFKSNSDRIDMLAGRISTLENREQKVSGRSEGSKTMWGYVVAGILLLIAIFGWIDKFAK
jgi:hypothetical protein